MINPQENSTFSYPTLHTGSRLLIKSNGNQFSADIWSFLYGFDLEIWLLILFTTIFVGLLFLFLDNRTIFWTFEADSFYKIKESFWLAFSSIFFSSELQLQKNSQRILLLTFWFVMLMLGCLYICTITINFNMKNMNSRNF